MAADGLAPRVTRSSAAMVLTVDDKWVIVFHAEVSEWLNLMTFLGAADSEVHIVHISCFHVEGFQLPVKYDAFTITACKTPMFQCYHSFGLNHWYTFL